VGGGIPFALVLDGVDIVELLRHVLGDVVEDEFVASFGSGCVRERVPLTSRSWLMKYPARLLWYCVMNTPGKYDMNESIIADAST
jgi:hypothetical protein